MIHKLQQLWWKWKFNNYLPCLGVEWNWIDGAGETYQSLNWQYFLSPGAHLGLAHTHFWQKMQPNGIPGTSRHATHAGSGSGSPLWWMLSLPLAICRWIDGWIDRCREAGGATPILLHKLLTTHFHSTTMVRRRTISDLFFFILMVFIRLVRCTGGR